MQFDSHHPLFNFKMPKCKNNHLCDLKSRSRKTCRWCRLQKCLEVGMKKERVLQDDCQEQETNRKIVKAKSDDNFLSYYRIPKETIMIDDDRYSDSEFVMGDPNQRLRAKLNEFVWIKGSENCTMPHRVLDFIGESCDDQFVIVEVAVLNGIVVGTDLFLEDLLDNRLTNGTIRAEETDDFLSIKLPKMEQLFRKSASTALEVTIEVFIDDFYTPFTLNHSKWSKLVEVINVSRLLASMASVYYIRSVNSTKGYDEKVTLILGHTLDNYTKSITLAAEEVSLFPSLPLEDQLILLKEGIPAILILFFTMLFDKKSESWTLSAFNKQLWFGMSFRQLEEDPDGRVLHEFLCKLFSAFPDSLRLDPFIVCILCIIVFLQESEGISSTDLITEEQEQLTVLLETYLTAKYRSNKDTLKQFKENINCVLELMREFKESKAFQEIEKQKFKSLQDT